MITKVKGSTLDAADAFNYTSVLDEGAVGDGITDDTAAFNAAFATGLPVFVPAGTYIVSNLAVPNGTTLYGTGISSILKLKAATAGAVLTLGTSTEVRDIKIDGNKANQASVTAQGICITNAVATTVRNVLVADTFGDGVNINGAATSNVSLICISATGFAVNGVKIENGSNIHLDSVFAYSSDLTASPGDGISLTPVLAGASINMVTLNGCESRSNKGRGIYVAGFGSKNVDNISINGCITSGNTSHGVHLITTEQVLAHGNISKSNGGDGIRLEGDTVYCRVSGSIADSNTGFGIREVTTGSTPDNNTLYYNMARNNTASNVITKVGAASAVV